MNSVILIHMTKAIAALLLLISCHFVTANDATGLSNNILIKSTHLGYDVQYRIFIPKNYSDFADLPTIYVTDGQGYIKGGAMPRLMKKLIAQNRIRPTIGVFIDSRDPDDYPTIVETLSFPVIISTLNL